MWAKHHNFRGWDPEVGGGRMWRIKGAQAGAVALSSTQVLISTAGRVENTNKVPLKPGHLFNKENKKICACEEFHSWEKKARTSHISTEVSLTVPLQSLQGSDKPLQCKHCNLPNYWNKSLYCGFWHESSSLGKMPWMYPMVPINK